MTRTAQQRQTRSRQIVAARIRRAADSLEMAMHELEGAQHDADTTPGLEIDVLDALELGIEPDEMVTALRSHADRLLRVS